jgi:uncharacterized membrane protein YccC
MTPASLTRLAHHITGNTMLTYTPELLAAVRQEYLHSDDTLEQIAAQFNINARDISRMRELEGWPSRYRRVRRVPRIARMLGEAKAVEAQTVDLSPNDPGPPASAEGEPAASALPSLTDRMERLIEQEIAAEERMRAELGRAPRRRAEAKRCATTLATLTQTLAALARLRGGTAPEQGPHDDHNLPTDIDEFRRELARRIEAFVASQPDDECDDGDRAPLVAAPE